jgi:hypothetical protein
MEQVLAGDVADLVDHEVAQRTTSGFPTLDVVELRALMDRRPLVPERPIGRHVPVHAAQCRRSVRARYSEFR